MAFAYLAAAAAVDPDALLPWDEPVHEWVRDETPARVVDAFDVLTWLGANHVVFPAGLVLAWAVSRRSAAIAVAVLLSVAARPVVQLTLKPTIGRSRPPPFEETADHGFAFPSGHVLSAVSLWLLLPLMTEAWGAGPAVRRAATAAGVALVLVVAASRVILGVHWLSDVAGSMLLGAIWVPAARRAAREARRGSAGQAGEGVAGSGAA